MRRGYSAMIPNNQALSDAQNVVEWAKGLLAKPDEWVILDTETTGLEAHDQICQIAVIDGAGNVLIDNQLIRPTCPMNLEAKRVHGLSMEVLKDAPTFEEYRHEIIRIIGNKTIVIYNAPFDIRMLNQTQRSIDNHDFFSPSAPIQDAMEKYAEYVGDWSTYHGNYRWQKLPQAAHDALGDCKAVLEVIKKMAAA